MMIDIQCEIPDDVIARSAYRAAVNLFNEPKYGREGAVGYSMIADAAAKAVAEIDWMPVVKDAIARLSPDIVRDVTGNALRSMIRAQVKALKEAGELL